MADAIEWVSRITVIALEMVLPGIVGQWLDKRYGLNFLALIGFAFGLTAGMWHLLVMTKAVPTKKTTKSDDTQKEESE